MENEHVISGLVRKRREIAGMLMEAEQRFLNLHDQLCRLDQTIRDFDAGIVPGAGKPVQTPRNLTLPLYGKLTRRALEVLRDAAKPMSARDITVEILVRAKLPVTAGAVRTMQKRVGEALRLARARGTATSEPGRRLELLWLVI